MTNLELIKALHKEFIGLSNIRVVGQVVLCTVFGHRCKVGNTEELKKILSFFQGGLMKKN